MTSRERVMATLNHKEPDQVPIDYGGTIVSGIHAVAQSNLEKHLGLTPKPQKIVDTLQQLAHPDPRIREIFGGEIYGILPQPPKIWQLRIQSREDGNYYYDEWGVQFRKPSNGWWFDPWKYPLARANTIKNLEHFDWPDPYDSGRTENLRERVKKIYEETDYAIVVTAPYFGILEMGSVLRGMENWFTDLLLNPKFAQALLERVLEFNLGYWDHILSEIGLYVQVVQIGDDLGSEQGLIISPQIYRKLIKPLHQKVCKTIKSKTRAKVFFHSCGEIYDILPDIIEVGIDIVNPIQVSCKKMGNTEKLKKEFGKDLVFWGGGVDTQTVLPRGSEEDVKKEVKRRIQDLAPGGGYVFSPVHNIQPEVPPQNLVTAFNAAKKYGE